MKKRTGRKGASLAEMAVVLAVIAIVSLVVVSFTTMVSTRSAISVTKLNVMNDLQLTESILESWVERMCAEDVVFTAEDTVFSASTKDDGKIYRVTLEDEQLTAQLPGGEALSCPVSTVTAFRFSKLGENDGEIIFFCTAQYELMNLNGDAVMQEITFCINPYLGETVG